MQPNDKNLEELSEQEREELADRFLRGLWNAFSRPASEAVIEPEDVL